MNAETKLAHQRLSVLQLAESLGNIAAACRQRGISRTQFYEHKRRFQAHGLEGLKDLPPISSITPGRRHKRRWTRSWRSAWSILPGVACA